MLNRFEGIGNLGKDPETRYTQGQTPTAICRFSIAVDHGYGERKKTVWINVATFGKLAENCQKYLAKGRKVYVAGELDIREYQKQDGSKGYITEVTARDVEFLSGQEQQNFGQQTQQQSFAQPAQPAQTQQPAQPQWSNPEWGQQQSFADAPAGFQQMAAQEDVPF